MGFEQQGTFERREEWNAARLTHLEYEEMARVLKALADEQGQPEAPVLDALAHKGPAAALASLAEGGAPGAAISAGFYRKLDEDRTSRR